jgi:hypothetical protein
VVCCLQVLYQNPVPLASPHSRICNIPSSLNLLILITRISASSSLQIMKILIMQYFPFSCYLHPLMQKHHVSGHLQVGPYILAFMCKTNFCPCVKQRIEIDLKSTVGWFSLVCSDALMFRFDSEVTWLNKAVEKLRVDRR